MASLSLPPYNSHLGLDMPGSAPRFLCFPRSMAAPVGTHAVLRCQISGDPPPSVVWERVGNIHLELGERCYAEKDGDWYQLVISDLRLEDSGHYMCRASNWFGEGYAGAKLTVTLNSVVVDESRVGLPNDLQQSTKYSTAVASGEPNQHAMDLVQDQSSSTDHGASPNSPPHFLLVPNSQRLACGQSGEFSCRVSGMPEPTIRWEKDGRALEEIFDRSHYRLSPEGHSLYLSHVRPPDAGVYVCRAANSLGQSLAAAVLLVDPMPRHGPEPLPGDPPAQVKVFTVNEGKHAKLRCLVTGKPRPEIVWRKDGRAVSAGRRTLIYEDRDGHFILKVLFCRQQDRGLYVCGASNTAGNTLSAVMLHVREVGDRFPAPLRDIAVREGQDAMLECSVPEGTRTSWYLEDQRLHPGKRHLMEEHGSLRRLIIRGARTDDDGVYVCQTNRGAQSIAEVAVRGPIVKKLPRRLEVAEGGNAAFCAETESEMEQVGWTRDGHILSEDHKTVVSSFGRTHVLVLVGVSLKDSGIIQFHAGLSESSCQLRVKARGSSIAPASGEPANRTLDAGQPICLSCQVPSSGAKVRWMKDGQEVDAGGRISLQSDGRMRRLLISSSDPADTGTYTCHSANDSTSFTVTVSEPPVKIINTSDDTEHKCVSGEPMVLSCELSRENAPVRWYRNGVEVEESENIRLESDGRHRRLVITCSTPEDAGEFVCNAGDDSVFYNVTVTKPPVKIINTSDDTEHKCVSGEPVVLSCELSRENARVRWYRDGVEVEESENIRLESDGRHRRLVITCATPEDAGEFMCDTGDDSVFFNVTVTEAPVRILNPDDDTDERCLSGEELTLSCEVSRENAKVRWYKDGERVEESERIHLETDGRHRHLVILATQTGDSGEFVCDAGDDSIFYYVAVTDPPVKIVNTGDDVEYRCLSGEQVMLSCQVSRENAQVCWYKDGVEVEENEGLVLESDGKHRRLVIPNAQVQDSGEFTCDARDDCVFYNVIVTEPPVRIVNTCDDTELTYLTGECLELSCEVSRENALVRWYKDGAEVEDIENIRVEAEGRQRRLIIPSVQTQDSGEFVCDARDDSIVYCVKVTEPPVKFVNTIEDTDVECVSGEPVVLSCELSRENARVRWYRDGVEVEESENIRLESDGRHRRLVIQSAQPQDSGEFVCDAGDDAVFYSVLVTEPPTRIVFPEARSQELEFIAEERVELVIDVSKISGAVRWFKDGLEVDEDENLQVTSDGCRRCLILSRATVEDSGEYICDTDSDSVTFDVKVSEPPAKIMSSSQPVLHVTEGDPLSIACELSRVPDVIRWLKDGEEVTPDGNVTMDSEGERCTLSLLCAEPGNAGQYECNVGTDSRTFQVYVDAPPVTIVGNTGTPEHHVLMTGDDLVLACELSRPNFKVRWLRDGEELVSGGRVKILARGVHRQVTIQSVRPSDSGTYTCDAGTDQLYTEVCVEAPRQVEFITELQNITLLEGDTATFKCVLTPEDAILNWELNGSPLNSDRRASMASNGLCHSLTLHGCRLSDSGTITANAEGIISRARLRVQEAHVMFSQGLEDIEVEEEQDVTLQVKVTTERAEVHWVKQGVVIQPSSRFTLDNCGQTHTLTIHGLQASDRGRYSCESLHDRTDCRLNVLPKSISVRKGLADVSCEEGSDVEFSVELSHEGLIGEWWKGGVCLTSEDGCVIRSSGRQHFLCLKDLRLPDSSVIAFTTDTLRSTAHLTVTEHPLTITQPPQDFVVNEAGLATFQCEISKQEAVVTWSKDGEKLTASSICRMFSVGRRRILHLNQCGPQDAGTYTCHVGDLTASALLRVLEQEPQMVKDLQDVQIVENENAAFICEVSCAQAKGEWFKNGEKVKVTSTTKIRQEGRRHFLLICGAQCEDSGEILFRARRAESRAKLQVTELPVRIVKSLRDKTAMQGHRVILECKVSPARARVTWLRGSQVILPSDKYQISSDDGFRTLTINNVSPEDEDNYTMKTSAGQTSARVLVEGLAIQLFRHLRDVKVTAPDDACFECEVSIPLSRPPQWSLNGVGLHEGDDVTIENRGNRHRLTLRNTHPGMSGTIRFMAGKTRSEAQLAVQEQ